MKILKYCGDISWEKAELAEYGTVSLQQCSSAEELEASLADTEILLADVDVPVTRSVINRGQRLKLIVCYSSGYDYVDVNAASQAGITVCSSPGYAAPAVAELTIGLMLCLARSICRANYLTHNGYWEKRELIGTELAGKKVGIIGLGNIGRLVAEKCHLLGMTVYICSSHATEDEVQQVRATKVPFDRIFSISDFVSINIDLTSENRNLVGRKEITQMKRSSYLINLSRGGLVN